MHRKTTMAVLAVAVALLGVVAIVQTGGGVDEVDATDAGTVEELKGAFISGGDYALSSDITISEALTLGQNVTLVLDLNGHTITANVTSADNGIISVSGDLTIRDSSPEGTGKIVSSKNFNIIQTQSGSNLTIESGIFELTSTDGGDIVRVSGNALIEGGEFIYHTQPGKNGYPIRAINGGNVTINDMHIDSDNYGIQVRTDKDMSPTSVEINGGTIEAAFYGLVVLGNGETPLDNSNAVLIVNDVTVIMNNVTNPTDSESVCIGTTASGGIYAGFTITVNGGTFQGNSGCYFPGEGDYNINGGHFLTTQYGIRIAAGDLTIGKDAVIETNVNYESKPLETASKPTGTMGPLVIGKVGDGYTGNLNVVLDGGTLRNNLGNAVTAYDKCMGLEGLENYSISFNANSGNIIGNVEFDHDESDSDSSNLSFALNGATIEGKLSVDTDMEGLKTSFNSGVITGGTEGVDAPATHVANLDYLGTTLEFIGSGFQLPNDLPPSKDNYTFLGLSLNSGSSSAQYQPGDFVSANGDVTVYAVWESNSVNIPSDDDELPPFIPTQPAEEDDTVTIVACAAAAAVAAILAVFLVIDRKG